MIDPRANRHQSPRSLSLRPGSVLGQSASPNSTPVIVVNTHCQ
jgi:hypothetical protein